MNLQQWLKELNAEIDRLTKIRDLILSGGDRVVPTLTPSLPAVASAMAPVASKLRGRQMSEAVKAKLRAAAKKRWAAIKAGKTPKK